MLVKTSELSGVALDWAVAQCEGERVLIRNMTASGTFKRLTWLWAGHSDGFGLIAYEPSTAWLQGGPIIDHARIRWDENSDVGIFAWNGATGFAYGPTILIAAMRCLVVSEIGGIIEIPDELLK